MRFFNTAYPPVFVALVTRESFADANGKVATVRSVSFLAGPAAGGGLISLLTAPFALLVDAASYLVSALLLHRIPLSERVIQPAATGSGRALLSSAREGLRFVLHHRFLRSSLACATTLNLFQMAANALVILYASRELGLSAAIIGLALGAGAVGGVVTAAVAARLGRLLGVGRAVIIGAVVSGASFGVLPLASGGGELRAACVLGATEFVGGVGIMLFDVNLNGVQASVTPDDLRSRVSGAFSTINYGVRPLGALLGGLSGTLVGIGPTLLIAAVGGAASASWLLWSPIRRVTVMRDLDTVDPMTGLEVPAVP